MMGRSRFLLAVTMATAFLLPSMLLCAVSLHVALDHAGVLDPHDDHGDHHARAFHHGDHRDSDHDHSHAGDGHAALAAVLAQVVVHGHHHEKADAPDHDHEATAASSTPCLKPHASPTPSLRITFAAHHFAAAPAQTLAAEGTVAAKGAGPPLFAANCSLLI